jgi:hypothetical protein
MQGRTVARLAVCRPSRCVPRRAAKAGSDCVVRRKTSVTLHRPKLAAPERPLPFSANSQFRENAKNSGRDFYDRFQRLCKALHNRCYAQRRIM